MMREVEPLVFHRPNLKPVHTETYLIVTDSYWEVLTRPENIGSVTVVVLTVGCMLTPGSHGIPRLLFRGPKDWSPDFDVSVRLLVRYAR